MTNHDYDAVSQLDDAPLDNVSFEAMNNTSKSGDFIHDVPGAAFAD